MYRTVGYSKRAIARELDVSRKTVHKVIAEYEAALNCDDPESSLESVLTIPPIITVPGEAAVLLSVA